MDENPSNSEPDPNAIDLLLGQGFASEGQHLGDRGKVYERLRRGDVIALVWNWKAQIARRTPDDMVVGKAHVMMADDFPKILEAIQLVENG
jgi:hypothetical protein